MQVITTGTQGASGLFAGLFGQQNQAGGGLFGMLMAVFGQNGAQGLTGQNLPSALPGATGTLPKLPISNVADLAATSGADLPTDLSAQLMPLLQQLAGNPDASGRLKNLLAGGEQLDMATFQQRLASLDDATRAEVIGEIAALLQPVLAAQQPVLLTPADQGDDVIADGLPATAAPAIANTPADLPEQPQDRFLPIAPAPKQAAPAEGDATASTPATAQAATTPRKGDQPAAEAAPATNSKGAIDLAAFEQLPPETRTDILQRATRPAQSAAAREASQQAAPIAAVQQPQQTQPSAPLQRPTASAERTEAIKAAGAAGRDSNTESGLKNLLPDNSLPQPAAAAQDKGALQQASFTDHLQNVKLNRTGAHIPVAEQISVQLNRAVSEGKDRFTVRLSPAELGRIEIRIDVGSDGQVTASFKVDQPATLDLLQRDQRGLERALADAGLKADSGALNFNLRGDGNSQQQGQQAQNNSDGSGQNRPGFSLEGDVPADETLPAGTMDVTWYVGPDRLDVRV